MDGSSDFVLGSAGNTNARPRTGKALGDSKVNAAGASYNEDRTIVKINVKGQGWFCASEVEIRRSVIIRILATTKCTYEKYQADCFLIGATYEVAGWVVSIL